MGLAFGERPRTSYMFSYLSVDFSSWQTAQVEVQMRCARHSWDLRRHCRRRVALYKMFHMYTRTCTRTSIHTDAHEEVTKRCDCPGRITRGRCTYSQAASSVMGNKHARAHPPPQTHAHRGVCCFCWPSESLEFPGTTTRLLTRRRGAVLQAVTSRRCPRTQHPGSVLMVRRGVRTLQGRGVRRGRRRLVHLAAQVVHAGVVVRRRVGYRGGVATSCLERVRRPVLRSTGR